MGDFDQQQPQQKPTKSEMCVYAVCCVYFAATVYRFNSLDICYNMGSGLKEVTLLTDGDVLSCEPRDDSTVNSFGLFFTTTQQRRLILKVIGSHLNCNPVTGLRVAIVSISHQISTCQSMISHSSDRYSCLVDNVCSYVAIQILGVDDGKVCEITSVWY